MTRELSPEVVECAGCGGEVPVTEAIYLPGYVQKPVPVGCRRPIWVSVKVSEQDQKPYCCRGCYLATLPEAQL